MRESPALDILELLSRRGAVISYSDPWVRQLKHGKETLPSIDLAAALQQKPDCAVICTDHSAFDYDALVASGTLIVDTRNALKGHASPTIFRL
jgi:UDP-N-acetyl-D-glucosamine dehydrogenase